MLRTSSDLLGWHSANPWLELLLVAQGFRLDSMCCSLAPTARVGGCSVLWPGTSADTARHTGRFSCATTHASGRI